MKFWKDLNEHDCYAFGSSPTTWSVVSRSHQPMGAAGLGNTAEVQLAGGNKAGWSGGPIAIHRGASRGYFVIGVIYRGGEASAFSRAITSDAVICGIPESASELRPLLSLVNERFEAIGSSEREVDDHGIRSRDRAKNRVEKLLNLLGQPHATKFCVLRDLEEELQSADDDSELPLSNDPIPVILESLINRRSLRNISGLSEIYDRCCDHSDCAHGRHRRRDY